MSRFIYELDQDKILESGTSDKWVTQINEIIDLLSVEGRDTHSDFVLATGD